VAGRLQRLEELADGVGQVGEQLGVRLGLAGVGVEAV